MTQNRFAALNDEKPQVAPVGGRDSKRHEPAAPVHGRQFDHNSVKGERRFPSKEGRGKGGWGDKKDTRPPREETAEQKARREEREKEHTDMLVKHEEYLKNIQTLEDSAIVIVAPVEVEVQKHSTLPQDIKQFGKTDKKEKNNKARRTDVMIE